MGEIKDIIIIIVIILDWIILHCGDCSVHCRMFVSITYLHLLDARITLALSYDKQKCVQIVSYVPCEAQLRTTNLRKWRYALCLWIRRLC